MKPLTIAITAACPFPTWQGSQVLIRQMAETLSRRGHNIHLVTYGFGEYELKASYRVHRIPRLPLTGGFRSGPSVGKIVLDAFLAIELISVVRNEGVDIIHAHNHEAVFASFPASRLFTVPLVYHSHTILSRELFTYFHSEAVRTFARRLAPSIDRLTLALADHLVAVSEEELEFFSASGRRPDEFTLVPPGIVVEGSGREKLSSDIQEERADGAHEMPREEEMSLCYMGNLDPYQNLDTLFRAVRSAAEELKGIRLFIVTRSDWREEAKRIREMGLTELVRFVKPGTFEDALSVLKKSSVAVITRNVRSGFPIKLLNYMACGKAIIASRSAAGSLEHGMSAWVVEDDNERELARAIIRLLGDESLRSELGQHARELAASQFDWDTQAARLENIYNRLLEGDPAEQIA